MVLLDLAQSQREHTAKVLGEQEVCPDPRGAGGRPGGRVSEEEAWVPRQSWWRPGGMGAVGSIWHWPCPSRVFSAARPAPRPQAWLEPRVMGLGPAREGPVGEDTWLPPAASPATHTPGLPGCGQWGCRPPSKWGFRSSPTREPSRVCQYPETTFLAKMALIVRWWRWAGGILTLLLEKLKDGELIY